MNETTYPTSDELADIDPGSNVRSPEAVAQALARQSFDNNDVAAILNVSHDVATWLMAGGHEYLTSSGTSALTPLECFPSQIGRAVGDFRSLVSWCEAQPQNRVEPMREELANATIGSVDAADVAWLTSSLHGFTQTGARRSTPLSWVQSLQSLGISVASFAMALGEKPETVLRWLTGVQGVPVSETGEKFYVLLSFLATGPVRGALETGRRTSTAASF